MAPYLNWFICCKMTNQFVFFWQNCAQKWLLVIYGKRHPYGTQNFHPNSAHYMARPVTSLRSDIKGGGSRKQVTQYITFRFNCRSMELDCVVYSTSSYVWIYDIFHRDGSCVQRNEWLRLPGFCYVRFYLCGQWQITSANNWYRK